MVLWGDYTTMPRGGQEILGDPFRTWVVTVDEKNRVRLPLEIGTVVPWIDLKAGQIECVGMPGPWGGIQVTPLTDRRQDVLPFAEAAADMPPTSSESHQRWVEVARLLATAWLLPVNVEASQIRITLPESLRRAQQVPQSGGAVIVFGFGSILEIWDALKWHEHVRAVAKRKAAAISEALEDLRQR
jgi:DNA-binding transcriptional regulator/RsmH inhibitor MraZ